MKTRKKLSVLSMIVLVVFFSSILTIFSKGKIVQATVNANTIQKEKLRTVITTDGEVDDMNSFIRFLLYSDEVDLAGVVLTSSTYHYAGDEKAGIKPYRWTGTQWIQNYINAYEKVYPNLKIHANGYPTPDYLRSVTKIGNIKNVGEMDEVTEGSELLKKLFLDDDNRKLYVQTWGGTNTTAKALKSIEEEYSNTDKWQDIQRKINDKVILYIILDQDDSYSKYIAKKWPNIRIINDRSNFWHFAYAWKYHTDKVNSLFQGSWLYPNIKLNHGELLDKYAVMGDGNYIKGELDEEQRGTDEYLRKNPQYNRYDFISEGDSPSFLYLINNGLRSLEDPTYGGWGGRFGVTNYKLWQNNVLDYDPYTNQYESEYSLMRWFNDIQNDFAARADWCVTNNYKDANHAPDLTIKEGINLNTSPAQIITLHAKGLDPDGDNLSYKWWHYAEADTYKESKVVQNSSVENKNQGLLLSITRKLDPDEVIDNVKLYGSNTDTVKFMIPSDAKSGDTIHIIAEVKDNGKSNLKHYQRIIITVR